jgi:hypothetical protein
LAKYHSTISRRDFLKILSLGSIGLGTTAISAPVIHDLDELLASPLSELKRPWHVKEIDKPTVDINWSILQRFDEHLVMWYAGLRNAVGEKQENWIFKLQHTNRIK